MALTSLPAPHSAAVPPERDDALAPGTRLAEFELLRVLGSGGFGIVYLAMDHALRRQVAIKEYMPGELARRADDSQVSARSASHEKTFAMGLRSFINEAQLLAHFDHPSLVKVYRFWEQNGTAYMVMPYYAGRTLKDERRAMHGPPDAAWLQGIVEALLGALDALHREGVYHRDISPDNILLLPDGRTVLLDFGAARQVVGDRTQALTTVFKPNFAPIEQCGNVPGMRQGPWTDLYSLGAVIHYMLTAKAPVPAVVRAVHDHLPALSVPALSLPDAPFGCASAPFLAAIDWALGVRPHERPQSVQAMRDALDGSLVPPPPAPRFADLPPEPEADADPRACGPWPATMQPTSVSAAPSPPADARAPALQRPAEPAPATAKGRRLAAIALAIAGVCGLAIGARFFDAAAAVEEAGSLAAPAPRVAAMPAPAAVEPAAAAAPTISTPPSASLPAQRPERKPAPAPRRVAVAESPTRAPAAAPVTVAIPVTAAVTGARAKASAAAPEALNAIKPSSSPRGACGDRNVFSMAVCMTEQCRDPAFAQHAQCLEFNRYAEARRQAEMGR